MWVVNNIASANIPFLSTVLGCDKSNKSKNHTKLIFYLLLGFAENQIVFGISKLKIVSDNQGFR